MQPEKLQEAAEVVSVFLDNEPASWVEKLQKLDWVNYLAAEARKKSESETADLIGEWVSNVPRFISSTLQVGNFQAPYYKFIEKICAINKSEDPKKGSDVYW